MNEAFLDAIGFILVAVLLLFAPLILGIYLAYQLLVQAWLPPEKRFGNMTLDDLFHPGPRPSPRPTLTSVPTPQEKAAYAAKETEIETRRKEKPRRFGT